MSWGSLEAAESFQQELPYLPGDASEEQIEAATKYASWLDVFCRQSNQIRDWMWDYVARRKDHVREQKKAETNEKEKAKTTAAKTKKTLEGDDWGSEYEEDPAPRPAKATHKRKEELKASAPATAAGPTRSRTPDAPIDLEVLLDEHEKKDEKRTHGTPDSRDPAPSGRSSARPRTRSPRDPGQRHESSRREEREDRPRARSIELDRPRNRKEREDLVRKRGIRR